ncbi:helix-turn-helix domain-containing protein [Peribacillus frigoritolerans]|uniref:helix-turn-helix domain-containing protein n=1 Tax=Peribacillus frigoritolerans TaxID=450367 RepID=UPI002281C0F9|nr:helix-turn-helix transcriptional regulator [Peribacillus frigoritolerans]MCY8937866.1 helix-turn-helix domain-containing protein [Peribacillus frigoritolerans]
MMNLGEKLRALRLENGISTTQLELLSGISQSNISKIERNIQSPSVDTLLKITEALGTSLIDLFDISEELPSDLVNLVNTAKKLTPQQRKKVTEMIQSFLN